MGIEEETLEAREIRTSLGCRDITLSLLKGTFKDICKYDVVRDILLVNFERKEGEKKAYKILSEKNPIGGMVFPNDEIIQIPGRYDIIIQKIEEENDKFLRTRGIEFIVHAQIYHDFFEKVNGIMIPERLKVKVSGFGEKDRNPRFILFNYERAITGFINDYEADSKAHELYKQIKFGTEVHVEVVELKDFSRYERGIVKRIIHPLFKPLEILAQTT